MKAEPGGFSDGPNTRCRGDREGLKMISACLATVGMTLPFTELETTGKGEGLGDRRAQF